MKCNRRSCDAEIESDEDYYRITDWDSWLEDLTTGKGGPYCSVECALSS